MNTDKGCGGVPKGSERSGERWPFEMETVEAEEEEEEEYYCVKDNELLSGVADFYNNSKLSDITLSVGDKKYVVGS